jgi:hypothetical protein
MDLSTKEKNHYLNLKKGYQGEVMFDQLTEKLQSEMYVLNDLCLEANNSIFQIDTLIISQETIFLIEVKNYEGDYYYDSESFLTLSKNEILNPLDQVKRSKSLLRKLLQNFGYHLSIDAFVVFINPDFTLYQAPLNKPIIYPTQLTRFMKTLNTTPSKLNGWHKKLANQIISMHLNEFPYTRLPSYNYDQLKKGIICPSCRSFMIPLGERKLVCEKCGCEEDVESAVLRSVKEFRVLFPNKKITTNSIYDWCKVIESKKMIRRILLKNFNAIGERHLRYFK